MVFTNVSNVVQTLDKLGIFCLFKKIAECHKLLFSFFLPYTNNMIDFSFLNLKKNIRKDTKGFKKIKVAVLADSASQLICTAIKGYGYTVNLNIEIWEADYNQIKNSVYDETSLLYTFKPNYVLIYQSSSKFLQNFYASSGIQNDYANQQIEYLKGLISQINSKIITSIIITNFPEIYDNVYGNYANKLINSSLYQFRKYNLLLMNLAIDVPNVNISDLSAIQNIIGFNQMNNARLEILSDMSIEPDNLYLPAKSCMDIILAAEGTFKKCIIIDLDNTMWGGIIGDDGIKNIEIGDLGIGKAFTKLQIWLLQLKQRGIILAVCSKNTESIAMEPFQNHPDMVLRLDDIAIFVANWETKPNNIFYIQSILNIGFDSMVFLDDNPFEREMVKAAIPQIIVPNLPLDPVEYLPFLQQLNLFETASYTTEDKNRNELYRQEASRTALLQTYTDENEFLQSLKMEATIVKVTDFNLPRVAQLTQRSNQFNLRTIRYSEQELKNKILNDDCIILTINLKDKFGEYGLISAVILQKTREDMFIDTWIMSCRVLKRGVEKMVLNEIVDIALKAGCKTVTGEYLPTPKNAMVKEHYPNLNFKIESNLYNLRVSNYTKNIHFISQLQ